MAESQLGQYRAEIHTFRALGYSQADIIRALKDRYGIEVKRSTLSDYMKTLPEEGTGGGDIGGVNDAYAVPTMPEAQVTAVMQGAREEVLDRLAQLIEGVQQLKQEGDARHAVLMDTLQSLRMQETLTQHTMAFQALYRTLRGAALWPVYVRAGIVTGLLWGVGLSALYLWGDPAYAGKIQEVWQRMTAFLS